MEEADKQSIKYRLVGALVIIISFSLAWVLLLDHDVKRQTQWQQDIPEAIEIERFTVAEPVLVNRDVKPVTEDTNESKIKSVTNVETPEISVGKVAEKAKLSATVKKVSKPQPEKAKKESYTRLNKKGLPQAWVLQVASFKEKTNAKVLQQKLLKYGFPAYVKRFNVANGQIYRVLIGPKMDKKTVSNMAKKVERKLGLKTLLVVYKPEYAQP